MEWLKRIFILLMFSFLPGCSAMLGNYMDSKNPAPIYHVNGQVVRVDYVQLNPTWISNHHLTHSYRVGPYDILNIIVWDHPELTTITTQLSSPDESGFLVSSHGRISFPFAGTFTVAGLTLPQIQTLIAQRISKYIRNPQVTVRVAVFRSQEVQLLGEVGMQKTIPLTDRPTSLLDAINFVGGTNVITANTSHIYVIRGNMLHLKVFGLDANSPQMMMLAQRFMLKNNDIVYVPPLGITNWNRIIGQLAPSLAVPGTVRGTANSLTK